MDTREKIIGIGELPGRVSIGKWTVVPGLFDPLTAAQAKRISALAESGRKLAAIVLNGHPTLLAADARAALIAALRDINLVAIADGEEWRDRISSLENVRVIEDLQAEAARTSEFLQFVIERHKGV